MATHYTVKGIARTYEVSVAGGYPAALVKGLINYLEHEGTLPARTMAGGKWGFGRVDVDGPDGIALTVCMMPPDGTLIVGPQGWPERL